MLKIKRYRIKRWAKNHKNKLFGKKTFTVKKSIRIKLLIGSIFKTKHITRKNFNLPTFCENWIKYPAKVPLHSQPLKFFQKTNLPNVVRRGDAPYH